MLYLDHAASGPVRAEAREAMSPFLGDRFGNPSSHHTVGEDVAQALEDARRRVAGVLGMRPGDVIFTSGATEANNLAIKGIAVAALLRRGRPGHVVTTAIEHESVLSSAEYLQRVHGVAVTHVPVDGDGLLSPTALTDALRDDTVLVSVGYANNEIGTVQDAAALTAVTAPRRIPFHLDAVQAAGWLPLAGTGADALSLAGHKIGAPQGIGVLAIRGRVPLEPLLHGGGQERDRRSGTQNVAGAVGFAVALELAERERTDAAARATALRDVFIRRVCELVPEASLTGHPTRRLPGTASFTFAGVSGEAILLELERRGVVSSSGSACAAGSDEPSHVLVALGVAPEVAQTSVRFSFGHHFSGDPAPIADAVAASVAAVRSR
ncbi:cysteine desulfurase family protein [Microbacterium sp. NPDC079995]|uniref:cysteine desulfurase family protein n=1 Tax=unclassified Microbacterium TaxID=2609290 RepID=UPI00344F10C0